MTVHTDTRSHAQNTIIRRSSNDQQLGLIAECLPVTQRVVSVASPAKKQGGRAELSLAQHHRRPFEHPLVLCLPDTIVSLHPTKAG